MKIDQSIVYPDKQAQKVVLAAAEWCWQVVTPEAAFIARADGAGSYA